MPYYNFVEPRVAHERVIEMDFLPYGPLPSTPATAAPATHVVEPCPPPRIHVIDLVTSDEESDNDSYGRAAVGLDSNDSEFDSYLDG